MTASTSTPKVRVLGDLQRLQPQAGDVFVLSFDTVISKDAETKVRAMWREQMGDAKLLVLGKGASLGVVAAPAA